MQTNNFISNNKINTDLALQIYARAENVVRVKAEAEGKNWSAHEIAEACEPVLHEIFMKMNLTNKMEYEKIEKLINDWNPSSESKIIIKCGPIQQVLIAKLPEWQKEQKEQRNKQATAAYIKHLENEVNLEVDKINNKKTLENLYTILIKSPQRLPVKPELKTDDNISCSKKEIATALINSYKNHRNQSKINYSLAQKPKLLIALKKLEIVKQAEDTLLGNEPNKINKFENHLRKNKAFLLKQRDSGFAKFIKGLGVVAATIFGVGVGGYFAYHRLFGSKATDGGKFIHKVSDAKKKSAP